MKLDARTTNQQSRMVLLLLLLLLFENEEMLGLGKKVYLLRKMALAKQLSQYPVEWQLQCHAERVAARFREVGEPELLLPHWHMVGRRRRGLEISYEEGGGDVSRNGAADGRDGLEGSNGQQKD
jgi:hypothetical protein